MHKVFLGVGGNIGNKQKNFKDVYFLIGERLGEISKASSLYETPPWGFQSTENFWNQVIEINTLLSPGELLHEIHKIESEFGRKRDKKQYVSREMDIDILYYDNIFMETESLIIPHPRIHQRKFVLAPLVEIAPGFKHPLFRLTNFQLFENCKDTSAIKKI